MLGKLFYGDNLWLLFLVSVMVFLLVFEIGYRLGKSQRGNIDEATKSWIATIDGAILTMLSLLLAFSFGMAENRFDARKQLVVDEANAIGTTYLRSQWLSEPHRTEIARLLREYVDLRLPKDAQTLNVNEAVQQMAAGSEQLQDQLWSHAVEIAKKEAASPVAALFLATLNDTIDLQTKRLAAFRNRVPEIILLLLYIFAGFSILITGYVSGLRDRRNSIMMFTMIGLVAFFITVIVDLDRPQRGFIKVSQESLIQLQQKLYADPLKATK
jgi:hypothetical protein